MKTIYISLALLASIFIGIISITPYFLDLNQYKNNIEEHIGNILEGSVSIEGDIKLRILPYPILEVEKTKIHLLKNNYSLKSVKTQSIIARMDFIKIILGKIHFSGIQIIEPLIEINSLENILTINKDKNLLERTGVIGEKVLVSYNINSIDIVDGKIEYKNTIYNNNLNIYRLKLLINRDNKNSPIKVKGSANILEKELDFQALLKFNSVEEPFQSYISFSTKNNLTYIEYSGKINQNENIISSEGKLNSSGKNFDELINFIYQKNIYQNKRELFDKPYSFNSILKIKGKVLEFTNYRLEINKKMINGNAKLNIGTNTNFDIEANIESIYLTKWKNIISNLNFIEDIAKETFVKELNPKDENPFEILTGNIQLSSGLIEWNGQIMRNAKLSARITNSGLENIKGKIQLPGNSELEIFGSIKNIHFEPNYNLYTNLKSDNFRRLLSWSQLELYEDIIPLNKFNSFSLQAEVTGDKEIVNFNEINIVIDSTKIKGNATLYNSYSPKLLSDMEISFLDLNPYTPYLIKNFYEYLSKNQINYTNGDTNKKIKSSRMIFLREMNTNININIKNLILYQNLVKNFYINLELDNEKITLKNLSANNLAGLNIDLSGKIIALKTKTSIDEINFSINTENLSRFTRAFSIEVPNIPLLNGPISIIGSGNENNNKLIFKTDIKLKGLNLETNGWYARNSEGIIYNAKSKISHNEYLNLISDLGGRDYINKKSQPKILISAEFEGNNKSIQMNNLDIRIGENQINGSLLIEKLVPQIFITGKIQSKKINLDILFPPDPAKELEISSNRRINTNSRITVPNTPSVWSDEPIKLRFPKYLKTNITVDLETLEGKGLSFKNLYIPLEINKKILSIEGWKGYLYEGLAKGDLILRTNKNIEFETKIRVNELKLDQLFYKNNDKINALGKLAFTSSISGNGKSIIEIIESLNGSGNLILTKLEQYIYEKDSFIEPVLSPFRALDILKKSLGMRKISKESKLELNFTSTRGTLDLKDTTLKSDSYLADFDGKIDLGTRSINTNVLIDFFEIRNEKRNIPISINGSLDNPNININRSR